MAISSPRMARISESEKANRSLPANLISPPTILTGGAISLITDKAVIDLPHPDSPTSPSNSPRLIEKLTPSTARTNPARVGNCVCRFLTSSRWPILYNPNLSILAVSFSDGGTLTVFTPDTPQSVTDLAHCCVSLYAGQDWRQYVLCFTSCRLEAA